MSETLDFIDRTITQHKTKINNLTKLFDEKSSEVEGLKDEIKSLTHKIDSLEKERKRLIG